MNRIILIFSFLIFNSLFSSLHSQTAPSEKYAQLQKNLATGWNTWDTRSVLTQVLMPYGAAIDLNFSDAEGVRNNTFRIGGAVTMHPRHHAYDGSYTDISFDWHGLKIRVQTASDSLKNFILITPLDNNRKDGRLHIVPKNLWQRANKIVMKEREFSVAPYGSPINIPVTTF